MKLLYIAIQCLFVILQLLQADALNDSSSPNTLAAQEQLVQYYDKELNTLANDICKKLQNISEKILKDNAVQQGSTSLMQALKKNITHFQQIYGFYVRLNLNESLTLDFAKIFASHYESQTKENADSLYILKLLEKLGYSDIRDKYKIEFNKFVSEKFLPKFEEIKVQDENKTNTPKFEDTFLKWVDNLKACREYECYLSNFANSSASEESKAIDGEFQKMLDLTVLYMKNATTFARAVLKDQQLLQLNAPLRQQLTQNLQDFIKIYDNVTDMYEVFFLPTICYYTLFKFTNYSSISLEERQLITKLFTDNGYGQLELTYRIPRDTHDKLDYITQFENLKASLNQQHLTGLLAAIDNYRKSTTAQERAAAYRIILTAPMEKYLKLYYN